MLDFLHTKYHLHLLWPIRNYYDQLDCVPRHLFKYILKIIADQQFPIFSYYLLLLDFIWVSKLQLTLDLILFLSLENYF